MCWTMGDDDKNDILRVIAPMNMSWTSAGASAFYGTVDLSGVVGAW